MPQNPLAFTALSATGSGQAPGRVGKQSELLVGQRHGANYEAAYAASIGVVANPTGVTTSIGLATTYVGLCLSNPAGSGKVLALLHAGAALLVAPSIITTLSLAAGYAAGGITAHTTPLTPLNSKLGDATALVGLVDSACTLVGTPALVRILGQAPTATTSFAINATIDGGIIIPPGGWVAFTTNIAGPASGFVGSFMWEESPL